MLPNLDIIEKIAESQKSIIFKAKYKNDPERLLVIKVLKAFRTSEYLFTQFRLKIEQLKVLKDPMLIVPRSVGIMNEYHYIIYDYFDGVSLDQFLQGCSRIPLKEFFTIASRLTSALGKVHEAGIVHGGLNHTISCSIPQRLIFVS